MKEKHLDIFQMQNDAGRGRAIIRCACLLE